MKNTIVKDAVSRIMTQARVDERFRADFEKEVSAVYDSAEENAAPVTESEQFSADEIAAIRDNLKKSVNPVINVTVPTPVINVTVPTPVINVTVPTPVINMVAPISTDKPVS